MKKNTIVVGSLFTFLLLVISSFFVGAVSLAQSRKQHYFSSGIDEPDADLPVWDVGDSWTYDLAAKGEQNEYFDLDFDITIRNMKYEVVEVQEEMYKLAVTVQKGDFNGAVTVDLGVFVFSGEIEQASLTGIMYVKRSTLGMYTFEGNIAGETNKIILPQFNMDFKLDFEVEENNEGFKTNFSTLSFPMNIEDVWHVPVTYLNMSINAVQPNLGENRVFSYVNDHDVRCTGWDVVRFGTTEYDALRMSGVDNGETNDIWYSPSVGNIVKVKYENVALGFGYLLEELSFDLVSTTFETSSDPPEKPSTPLGPTDFSAGELGTYETSSVDPDGDKIRYIMEWDDGSDLSYSDFLISGEPCSFDHTWLVKGDHEVRVKARDKYGKESSWSDPLIVTVVNNDPYKPGVPEGPTSGKIKVSYTYSTSTTDPDDHQVQYGWDWDGDDTVDEWTDLFDSGDISSRSHTWNTQGSYNIKVKARDEYGAESEWSDPLSISMPRFKLMNTFLLKFLERHPTILLLFCK